MQMKVWISDKRCQNLRMRMQIVVRPKERDAPKAYKANATLERKTSWEILFLKLCVVQVCLGSLSVQPPSPLFFLAKLVTKTSESNVILMPGLCCTERKWAVCWLAKEPDRGWAGRDWVPMLVEVMDSEGWETSWGSSHPIVSLDGVENWGQRSGVLLKEPYLVCCRARRGCWFYHIGGILPSSWSFLSPLQCPPARYRFLTLTS